MRDAGSIQIDVPVNPVWPNEPTGKNSPRFDEYAESMSQPSPRTFGSPVGVAGDVMRAIVSGDNARTTDCAAAKHHPRELHVRSAAVLNTPACPATPPIRRAVGSWTTPRSIVHPGPRAWPSVWRHGSVGAMRGHQRRRRQKRRLAHVERRRISDRERNRASGRLLTRADDLAEQKEVDVAVDEPAARRIGQHFLAGQSNRFVVAFPVRPRSRSGRKPGHVRQQVANGDAVLAVSSRTPE